jgi:fermentation-respiration switch protein FrsA (DUF1100 family)
MGSAVLVSLIALGALNAWMYLQQPRMTFFPDRTLIATPADWGLEYDDVEFGSEDGVRLHGWYIPNRESNRVILFFHGNAGNISHRGDSIRIFHDLGLNVFIPDYRGYGRSAGVPDEAGLYRDATAAWRYLMQAGHAPGDIILFGRSLGGAVAAELAPRVDAAALILESTMSSARDFARTVFPLLSRVLVVRYRFDVAAAVGSLSCPVLVLHSRDDEIMPYRLGEKVYHAAGEPKRLVTLGGDHNRGFLQSQPYYSEQLALFIAGLQAGGGCAGRAATD